MKTIIRDTNHFHLLTLDCDLPGTVLYGFEAKNPVFRYRDMRRCDLSFAIIDGGNFRHAVLDEVTAHTAEFANCDFGCASFENACLPYASFYGSSLRNANFTGANLRYSDMRKCDMTGACFTGADMYGALLDKDDKDDFPQVVYILDTE